MCDVHVRSAQMRVPTCLPASCLDVIMKVFRAECTVPNAYVYVSVTTQNTGLRTLGRARVRTCFARVSIHARALFSCARVKFVIMLRNIKLLPEIMCLLLCIACSRK